MLTPALHSPFLQYMHTHDPVLLHRDLKPQNIYVAGEGDVPRNANPRPSPPKPLPLGA